MTIDLNRLRADIETLAGFGATQSGGVTRPSFSLADVAARAWLFQRCDDAGLEVRQDGIGNVFVRLDGPPGPMVWTGSHMDSVPEGGRLDGALGVVAGLECLRRLGEENTPVSRAVEMVAFADEEGAFNGFLGSRALIDGFDVEALAAMTSRDGVPLSEALSVVDSSLAEAVVSRIDPTEVAAFVELHIEQGPVLEAKGIPIGVVSDIVEISRATMTFGGRADHAGTTPMDLRRDAMRGAAAFLDRLPSIPDAVALPNATVTCGLVRTSPGALNIVPAEVSVDLDMRAMAGQVPSLNDAVEALGRGCAAEHDLDASFRVLSITPGVTLDAGVQDTIAAAADRLSLPWAAMASGAGHDSQVLAAAVPSGMIFVPSRGGRSHSPEEWTSWDDIEKGSNVLLAVLTDLATS